MTDHGHPANRPPLPAALDQSEAALHQTLSRSDDFRFQRFAMQDGTQCLVVYIEGLTARDEVQSYMIKPLMQSKLPAGCKDLTDLGRRVVQISDQGSAGDMQEIRGAIHRGKALLLVDGFAGALILGAQGWDERPVQSPPSESVLRGPRDGFNENLTKNIALVRRRLCDPRLMVEYVLVGERSQTKVALLYITDITPQMLVHELQTRLKAVTFDGILDSSMLRELLVGSGFSPFPKMELTERPDKVAASLLSGRAVILVDNTPFALLAPATLMGLLWAPDDYYTSVGVTLMVRMIRILGLLAAVFASPLYIAVQMYNPDLVRSDMALFMAQERLGIPLTASLEIYFLEIMMEIIHEATVRLPSKVGSAATVVGGLIVGQAAVQARVISGLAVIVVALSAIGSFTIPGAEMGQVWRATKWLLIIAASFFGVYGVFAAAFALLGYLNAQDSFGTPYLTPLSPFVRQDLAQDFLVRKPWGSLKQRPASFRADNQTRAPEPQAKKYKDGGER